MFLFFRFPFPSSHIMRLSCLPERGIDANSQQGEKGERTLTVRSLIPKPKPFNLL